VTAAHEALEELRHRLDRHPADRYPIQHATTRFHLGALLLERDEPEGAAADLERAVELFAELPAERAKARNMWGVARRATGDLDEAAAAFAVAAQEFGVAELPLEQAAALFNLGLVQLQLGEPDAAAASLGVAAATFDEHGAVLQVAAALREQGVALLTAGRPTEAVPLLTEALARAERGPDDAGRGQAANALGLSQLATGDAAGAVTSLGKAVVAHPAGLRPGAHAMAKTNLALAYEAADDHPRARLAAAQALVSGAPTGAVHDQGVALLGRLGPVTDDLPRTLATEDPSRWQAVIRNEAMRWLCLRDEEADAAAAALIEAMGDDDGQPVAEAWLGTLLEAPPAEMAALLRIAWRVGGTRAGFVSTLRDAIVTFPPPQLFRLEAVFAAETGLDARR